MTCEQMRAAIAQRCGRPVAEGRHPLFQGIFEASVRRPKTGRVVAHGMTVSQALDNLAHACGITERIIPNKPIS